MNNLAKAENEVENLNERLALIAHDLKNPLGAMTAMADLLTEMDLPETARYYARTLATSSNSLVAILNQLLNEDNKQQQVKTFNLKTKLKDTANLFQVSANRKNLKFYCKIADNVPLKLIGNATTITRIVNNLMSNAIKFTNAGTVGLFCFANKRQHSGYEIILAVADSGSGISPEKQPAIFSKYDRGDAATAGNAEGNGLGLFHVKQLVKAFDGKIIVDSHPNKGSIFLICIPLTILPANKQLIDAPDRFFINNEQLSIIDKDIMLDDNSGMDNRTKKAQAPLVMGKPNINIKSPTTSAAYDRPISQTESKSFFNGARREAWQGGNILAIDDNPINREILSVYLKKLGFSVETAGTGDEAIEKYKEIKDYRAILTDIQLPDISGVELITWINKLNKLREIKAPILAVTAQISKYDLDNYAKAGAVATIEKPLKPHKFLNALRSAIISFDNKTRQECGI